MFFRGLLASSTVVKVRAASVPTIGSGSKRPSPHSASSLRSFVQTKSGEMSAANAVRFAGAAAQDALVRDRGITRIPLSEVVRDVVSTGKFKKLPAGELRSLVDNCSALSAISRDDVARVLKHIQSVHQTPSNRVEGWDKCLLALWSASLWHGYPTGRFQGACMSLLNRESLDWPVLTRLAWCVYNDAATKTDPSAKARLDAVVSSRLSSMNLIELANLTKSQESPEFSVMCRFVLDAIAERAQSIEALSQDRRLPALLVSAWTHQRYIPADSALFSATFARAVKIGINPDAVFEAAAVLRSPINVHLLKSKLMGIDQYKPSMNQLSSLCLSFATLGLSDIESTSFLARHLHECLVSRNRAYHVEADSRRNLHKVGAWYAHVLASGSAATVAALTDAYKELSSSIASEMWEQKGRFVIASSERLDPAERAVRTVIAQSLASLGINSVPHAHIVNTPYVASLLLPDRDIALMLVSDVLSDGRFVGPTKLMETILVARGYHVRLMNTSEWEQRYTSESQDEFLGSLLKLIQIE